MGSVKTDLSMRLKFITATCVFMDVVKTQNSTE